MSNPSTNEEKALSNIWLGVSIGVTVAGIVLYTALKSLYNSENSGDYGLLFTSLLVSLAFVIISIVAIFKVRRWLKLIPIFMLLIDVIVFALFVFAYSLRGLTF